MDYGCIGERLAHSFSKDIHQRIASYSYELCEVPRDGLHAFMTRRDFKAVNVTLPYKEMVIPYLDDIDDTARAIGAVNTVVNRNGQLYGYNTDCMGMAALARRMGIDFAGKKVLILGTGGTSKTAAAVARNGGAKEIIPVSRRVGVTYEDAKRHHRDAQIIINTTPCGMYPHNEDRPIDLADYPHVEGVLDAVYNPLVTRLVTAARQRGIPAEGGLYMLVAQAVFASEKFTDTAYDPAVIDRVYRDILASKQNIVLTGMPSCGKSTVGALLAQMTGRELIDTDRIITEKHGDIATIFATQGEAAFRDMESAAVQDAARQWGCIIATGGGAVLREDNVDALRSNGRVFFQDRPLHLLTPTDDRPLAGDADAIRRRYAERYDTYCRTADVVIPAGDTPDAVARNIWEEMV